MHSLYNLEVCSLDPLRLPLLILVLDWPSSMTVVAGTSSLMLEVLTGPIVGVVVAPIRGLASKLAVMIGWSLSGCWRSTERGTKGQLL